MERVYKKTSILFKLLPCLLIVMCVFVFPTISPVYAAEHKVSDLCTFNFSDLSINYRGQNYKLNEQIASMSYLVISRDIETSRLIVYASNTPMYCEFNYNNEGFYIFAQGWFEMYFHSFYFYDNSEYYESGTYYTSYGRSDYTNVNGVVFSNYFDVSILYTNFDFYTNEHDLVCKAKEEPDDSGLVSEIFDYTNINNLPNNYFLLTGSRNIGDIETPVYLYCDQFLADWKYILAFYSENDGKYYLDLFFSNYPIYLKDVKSHSSGGFSRSNLSPSATIYCDGDDGFYHLSLTCKYFNNDTTTFNLTYFDIQGFNHLTKEDTLSSDKFLSYNIIYNNYIIKISDDNGVTTLSKIHNNGVLVSPDNNSDKGSELLTDNTITNIYNNITNIDNSTDISNYITEGGEGDTSFDTGKGGNSIKDAFGNIFKMFSFTDSIKKSFNDVYSFIVNQDEAPVLYYYYYENEETSSINKYNSKSGYISLNNDFVVGESKKFASSSTSRSSGGFSTSSSNIPTMSQDGRTAKSVKVIDLSWYAPYKSYVDVITAALIYMFFAWHIFRNLPSIISGSTNSIDTLGDTFNFVHRSK